MVRFMMGVLAAALLLVAWQWRVVEPGRAAHVGDELFQGARVQELPGEADPAPAGGDTDLVAARSTLAQGIRAGDVAALAVGFRELRAAEDAERGILEAALLDAAQRASAPEEVLALLGADNSFLHVEPGRRLARRVMELILALPKPQAEEAIRRSSRLLELCMHGRIEKDDVQAFGLVNELYAGHGVFVRQVVCDPSRLTKARTHVVEPRETLDGIAARFRREDILVEGWTLCYLNRIGRPTRLQVGKTIKIPTEPIWTKVDKASHLMAVYVGDVIFRLYWVGHGKDDRTPETTFTVGDKQPEPDWFAPDGQVYPFGHPRNVLGKYFVKFDHPTETGFGAHGTSEPDTIRTRSSLGCIRMQDADIEEYFRFIPRGTKVVVTQSR